VSDTPTTQQQQTPEELRREIERTRQELGETVDALSHKADVKEQARIKKDEVRQKVNENPVPLVAVAGGVLALWLLIRLVRRR
jgi:ElaB/YqjD/DUF883 family membrane-anchored ribosome-binding protein